ncbi:hypothetical protein JCM8202_004957 [Rhodotorula sphaerocarpa]
MAASEAGRETLRPLTLPTLPPDLAHLSHLKQQLARAHQHRNGYAALQGKLENLTDEPRWSAWIPFGPLAYFPGQLVHTNDITVPPVAAETTQGKNGQSSGGTLRSAKQAQADAELRSKELEAEIAALERDIATKEDELKQKRQEDRRNGKGKGKAIDMSGGDMGEQDWTINERGEVINEEGLPMFDIHEDLPAEPVASTSRGGFASGAATTEPPKRRFLIKKGGKQTIGSLNSPAAEAAPATPASPSSAAPALPPSGPSTDSDNPIPDRPRIDIKTILDELEAEERAEAAAIPAEEPIASAADSQSSPAPAAAQPISAAERATKPAASQAVKTASTGAGFAGFAPGFLTKSKQKRPSDSLPPTTAASSNAPKPIPSTRTQTQQQQQPPAVPAPVPPAALPVTADGRPVKPALSRPSSRASSRSRTTSASEKEKKRVAFDLPPPASPSEDPSPASKRAPILLGMGGESKAAVAAKEDLETISSAEFQADQRPPPPAAAAATGGGAAAGAAAGAGAKEPFVRPIRDTVVEKPLRKPVPPGPRGLTTATAAPLREKRVSRFKRMKEEAVEPEPEREQRDTATAGRQASSPSLPATERERRPQPEWNGPPEVVAAAEVERSAPGSVSSSDPSSATKQASPTTNTNATPIAPASANEPAPVHTISFKQPAADAPREAGTVSYADIPDDPNAAHSDSDFARDEDDYEEDDDDDDGFDFLEDDDSDHDAELDVDAALHAREVALAYHQQRLNLGGGRGTGALGGYHEIGQSPFGDIGRDAQGVVPADATLQSLDSAVASQEFGSYAHAGSAQLGKGSRFRNATRNLESAQLIIPSLLAADPTFTTSKDMLGPASGAGAGAGGSTEEDDLDEAEQERLRLTLEALAEGRPLPEDQQQYERQREIFLREELAHEKEERDRERRARERTAGKAPPELVQRIPAALARASSAPSGESAQAAQDAGAAPLASTVVERKPAAAPSPAAASADGPSDPTPAAPEPPKRMSRFRQKQLGLID